ncbi:MAG: T9SS type A sorting domain-containing protein, partial [Ignavibacteriaceae bacterium]|nr:T9SS type A sorting domain-containing protein [Ignavibacteriaceae bacterium]
NHTQNNNCQRNSSTAFEPGSAATIMGYAGICSPNLQNNSDDYFHIGSMVEISNFIAGSGNNCAVSVSNGNEKPVITTFPTGGFTIPINTPFKLTGAATDVDNTSITYCWEEYDLGPSGHPNTPSGNAPIFRSFNPETSGTRWFPKRANVFAGTQVLGEILPSYARNLKFRLVVRDNNPGAGNYVFSEITFAVAGSSPFKVTYPNTSVSIPALSSVNITWDVANTNVAPVNCQTVNVKLTTDGGNTFVTVANSLPNTGAATVTMPDVQTTTARLYIEAADNIFYDVSDANFTVTQAVPVELASFSAISNNGTVKLEWTTATETNNKGFFVERSFDGNEFVTTGYVEGKGTTTRYSEYVFTEKLTQSGNYSYRLKQVDYDGSSSFSNEVEVDLVNPVAFSLDQNYPNPFNPTTSISFSLPEASSVKIVVYDVLGNKITELLNGNLALGYHKLNFDAGKLNSGLYLYTITAQSNSGQSFSATRKMMLLK